MPGSHCQRKRHDLLQVSGMAFPLAAVEWDPCPEALGMSAGERASIVPSGPDIF